MSRVEQQIDAFCNILCLLQRKRAVDLSNYASNVNVLKLSTFLQLEKPRNEHENESKRSARCSSGIKTGQKNKKNKISQIESSFVCRTFFSHPLSPSASRPFLYLHFRFHTKNFVLNVHVEDESHFSTLNSFKHIECCSLIAPSRSYYMKPCLFT